MDKLVLGCGYLGERVANLWRQQGHRVWATTRSQERAKEFLRNGWQPLPCDVLRPDSLKDLPHVTTVLYAVGFDRTAGASLREVYVQGLKNVLDHLPAPDRFVHISSTGVYGQCDGEEVDETAAAEPLDESGRVVLEAERLVRERLPAAVILRFAGIYGPGRWLRQKALAAGEPIVGNPDHWLNLIHVADGVAAVLAAESHGRPGEIYNIGDGSPVRRRDFFAHLARELNAPEPCWAPPPDGQGLPARERADRRISNRKMLAELKVELEYPSYVQGLCRMSQA